MARINAKQNFEELLSEAVDDGLSSLGEFAKQTIYFYVEKSFNLKEQEIPYKVKDFATALEKFFGVGAKPLESLILKQLYEKIGGSFKFPVSKDLDFFECVAVAKQSIEPEQLETKI